MRLADASDPYVRKTQAKPVQLTLLPVVATVAGWVTVAPPFTIVIVALATALGVAFLAAQVARYFGRRAEPKLFAAWGGKPTSQWMLRADNNLDEETKARYRAYIEQHISGWKAPSQADEEADCQTALARYDSAVRWLREQTRDRERFDLVFKESVTYGYRRNAYGLKWTALVLASICVLVNGGGLYYASSISVDGISILNFVPLVISLAAMGLWLGIVNPRWVRDAADAYARALLAVCDSDRD